MRLMSTFLLCWCIFCCETGDECFMSFVFLIFVCRIAFLLEVIGDAWNYSLNARYGDFPVSREHVRMWSHFQGQLLTYWYVFLHFCNVIRSEYLQYVASSVATQIHPIQSHAPLINPNKKLQKCSYHCLSDIVPSAGAYIASSLWMRLM
jgi:hypothetical protein